MDQRGENIPEMFLSDNDNDPKIEICIQVHAVQRPWGDILIESAKENPSAVCKRYLLW